MNLSFKGACQKLFGGFSSKSFLPKMITAKGWEGVATQFHQKTGILNQKQISAKVTPLHWGGKVAKQYYLKGSLLVSLVFGVKPGLEGFSVLAQLPSRCTT